MEKISQKLGDVHHIRKNYTLISVNHNENKHINYTLSNIINQFLIDLI